jgi:putative endonuclease
MTAKCYYVYILTNALKTVLYTGVTNDLQQRIIEHYKFRGQHVSFTSKYNVYYLLFYEEHQYINNAIAREKEIKSFSRKTKLELIATMNPELKFLNEELLGEWPPKELTDRW